MEESQQVEFKREYTEDIKRTVIAFANGIGGKIYIGINDDGSVRGVEDVDEVTTQVMNNLRDAIRPDVMMFVGIRSEVMEGKSILCLTVEQGTARPYYLRSKGVRPEGVLVRQGVATVHASEGAIIAMIKETTGDSFENNRARNQQLTFDVATSVFDKAGILFEEAQKKTLGLIGSDGTYTNLALLLSDQCEHTIKVARFRGNKKTEIRARKEFGGSLFAQMMGVKEFIDEYNYVGSKIGELRRVDQYDYPIDAIREALLNAIVHREYGLTGSTLVSLYDDRLEIITLGGLVNSISFEEILLGVSLTRNPKLAKVFYRVGLVEAYGIGLRRIFDDYSDHTVEPKLDVTPNAFKITLPNVNYQEPVEIDDFLATSRVDWMGSAVTDPRKLKVLELLKAKGRIVRPDVDELLHISQSASSTLIREMLSAGYIRKAGSGRLVHYVLA